MLPAPLEWAARNRIERSNQHRLAVDSLAVAKRNSRNGKDILAVRRAREPHKTQHQERTLRGIHGNCPSFVKSAFPARSRSLYLHGVIVCADVSDNAATVN